jgi:hypothetical protein
MGGSARVELPTTRKLVPIETGVLAMVGVALGGSVCVLVRTAELLWSKMRVCEPMVARE